MPWEDRDAFNQFCSALVADYMPEGVIETELAQAIAEDHWRLNRARAIEHNIFALDLATSTLDIDSGDPRIDAALTQAQTFRDDAKTFGLLTLYEQRINRNLRSNVDRLHRRQTDRYEAREKALAIFAERRAEERKAEEREAAVRSSDPQPKRSGLIPTEGPQEEKPLVNSQPERSGLIPTEGPQEQEPEVVGFVHSNYDPRRFLRHQTLDERLADLELLAAESLQRRQARRKSAA
jgi:hypothetical protein